MIDAPIVKGMEDHKDNLILILAGYRKEMDWFIESNPGLRSRFPIHISFSDYIIEELLDIADSMLKQRQYVLSVEARDKLRFILERQTATYEHNGNARLVRNLIEKAIRQQAVRLVKKQKTSRDDLMSVTREDIEKACCRE